ncbi:MAG: DUF3291 domain-containing protein [Actinomycetota bacterium]
MQLAQLNIGRLVADTDDPAVQPFMRALDRINAVAEAHEGFVWRLQDDAGNATSFKLDQDPRRIPNLSVWTDLGPLQDFMYRTEHVDFLRRRREWFEPLGREHLVLWWVEDGHRPSLDEALDRLAQLEEHGPGPGAFTFRRAFDANGEPIERAAADRS